MEEVKYRDCGLYLSDPIIYESSNYLDVRNVNHYISKFNLHLYRVRGVLELGHYYPLNDCRPIYRRK
jgi:hypothetical protein